MSIQIGNTSIKEIYIGSTKIVEGYVGSTKFLKQSVAPAVSVWDGTYDYSWYNTTDTSFHLTTCAQFMAFAKLCNADSGGFTRDQFSGKTIYLDASMVINEDYANYESWGTSAPTYSMPDVTIRFNGTLDGQFHSITGAYYKNTGGWGAARLFDVSNTTLKDLVIENYYLSGDYSEVIMVDQGAGDLTMEGVIIKNGITNLANKSATEPTAPIIGIWEGSGSKVHTITLSHCGVYNTKFTGAYHNSGSQVENWGAFVSNERFGTSFTNIHGVSNMNTCFVCSSSMEPTNTNTSKVKYYKIAGTKTNTFSNCFEYDITARYGSDTPSTSVPTAQGIAASSTADLISRYNSANNVDKYTLKSDFTFKGNQSA